MGLHVEPETGGHFRIPRDDQNALIPGREEFFRHMGPLAPTYPSKRDEWTIYADSYGSREYPL